MLWNLATGDSLQHRSKYSAGVVKRKAFKLKNWADINIVYGRSGN